MTIASEYEIKRLQLQCEKYREEIHHLHNLLKLYKAFTSNPPTHFMDIPIEEAMDLIENANQLKKENEELKELLEKTLDLLLIALKRMK